MNITLSADAELIRKIREYAKTHNTSLNQLVRDYLSSLAGGSEAAKVAEEFVRLTNSNPGCSDGASYSRDSIYDRQNGQ